jgi:glycosyltransferase involved in cell wall biosynthesis
MNTDVTVSVIVPTRNRPALLRKSLDAIASQAEDVQLVVIDDGSTPECARENEELTQRAGPKAWATYHHIDSGGATGGGPAFARNIGIKLARGRFVAFCDDDDYWLDSGHLADCVRLFDEDPDLDFIFANQESRRNGTTSIAKQTAVLPKHLGLDSTSSGKSFLLSKDDCLLGWFPHLNTCVFRRELLEKINGFWGTACYEDLDLYVRAVDVARHVRYLDRTVAVQDNPIYSGRESVTSRLSEREIKVCATNVASHLMLHVRAKAAMRYARRFGGDAYRWLAEHAYSEADYERASAFARLGLGAKFSPKWTLMTAFLTLRRWV